MDMATNLFLTATLRGWFDGVFGGRGGDMHMMDWGRGVFFPGGFFMLLTGIALLLLLVWAVRSWSNRPSTAAVGASAGASSYVPHTPMPAQPTTATHAAVTPPVETPLHALQLRYAKGEISRAEYETIRHDLLADTPTGASPTTETHIPQSDPVEAPVASNETAAVDRN